MTLFTFGYEGLTINDFILRLTASDVRQVFDVRQLPLSRKRGFSKKAFALALEEEDVIYRHLPAFGCPQLIRDRYKVDEDWAAYEKAFCNYLVEQHEAIAELAVAARKFTTCLVCFEADFKRCHRSLVAQACRNAGGPQVLHLMARGVVVDEADRHAA